MPNNSACPPQPARPALVLAWLCVAAVLCAGFLALGVWQVQRLQWKLDLMDRIEQRVHAPAVAAPGPAEWQGVTRDSMEYSRVLIAGRFDHRRATLVRASTELGRGFWVVTPLQTASGFWVLVNRGFAPDAQSAQAAHPEGGDTQVIGGLLRMSEPGGSWLQHNDAAAGRWYSRDVQAIAANVKPDAAGGLAGATPVAPYFIDAAASADAPAWPRGGLTVLSFYNHHLVYAFTWFALAAMTAAGAAFLWHSERQLRAVSANDEPAIDYA